MVDQPMPVALDGITLDSVDLQHNHGARATARHGARKGLAGSAVEVSALVKRYGSHRAVDGLSFTVDYGRVVGFLGPNGAGKTTVLRVLLGLVHPTAGAARIESRSYEQLAEPIRTVGALLSADTAHPGRSGWNHLRVLARAANIRERRVGELVDLVGISGAAHRRVGGYSLGMRQRLGLAAALLGDPRVLVLDEPTNGLDPEGIRWLRDLLRSFANEGRAVLIASHALAEVAQGVDDVVIIRSGRPVLQSPVADLLAGRSCGVRVSGPDADRLGDLVRREGAHVLDDGLGSIIVADRTQQHVLDVMSRHQFVLHQLTPLGRSLEDVYLELIASHVEEPR